MARATRPVAATPIGEPPLERTPLRDNLEWIALAVLLVLFVRQTLVEAFRIEHGSMVPTLVGRHEEVRCPNCGWTFDVGLDKVGADGQVQCPNCRFDWDGGSSYDPKHGAISFRRPEWLWNLGEAADGTVIQGADAANRIERGVSRIFVNKLVYELRKPRRWEVAVFLYPYYDVKCKFCGWEGKFASLQGAICPDCGHSDFIVTARDFIKRVVGFPNETVSLQNGDIYINGIISRKPRDVQARMWQAVFDSRYMPRQEVTRIWDLSQATERWKRQPPGGVLSVDARGMAEPVMGAYAIPITDLYAYDGPSYELAPGRLGASGRNPVGDCRISARVRVLDHEKRGGQVLLQMDDAGHSFVVSVPVGLPGDAALQQDGSLMRRRVGQCLAKQQSTWLTLENYDGRLVARLGSRELFSYDYRPDPEGRHAVKFGAAGAEVLWERIIVERDIYYTDLDQGSARQAQYVMDKDEYFVLGDNSPASSDSRDSRAFPHPGVPGKNMIGKAFFVFWPVHTIKWL